MIAGPAPARVRKSPALIRLNDVCFFNILENHLKNRIVIQGRMTRKEINRRLDLATFCFVILVLLIYRSNIYYDPINFRRCLMRINTITTMTYPVTNICLPLGFFNYS